MKEHTQDLIAWIARLESCDVYGIDFKKNKQVTGTAPGQHRDSTGTVKYVFCYRWRHIFNQLNKID